MSTQAEIFESKPEEEQPPPSESVQEEAEVEEVIKIDKRKGKRKTPISEKQREQLLKNLAVGRSKGLETRRKKAELKRIEKESKNSASDKLLLASLQKRELKTAGSDALLKKIQELESKLLQQQEAPQPVPTPKPPPAPRPAPTPKPPPVQHKYKDQPPARPPTPTPTPSPAPTRSKKDLMKLMKSVR